MKIFLPQATIGLPILHDDDENNIPEFAIKHMCDFIAASFTRKAGDVEIVRGFLQNHDSNMRIFAKIENHEGVNNFDEILTEADGIIICRNQLSMDFSAEKLYIAQKWMLEKCNLYAKPVFVAEQILDSMTHNTKPTRHESADIANTIIDGADGFMLDIETSEGNYAADAVNWLVKSALEAEKIIDWR
jgi:pyruvate kinase